MEEDNHNGARRGSPHIRVLSALPVRLGTGRAKVAEVVLGYGSLTLTVLANGRGGLSLPSIRGAEALDFDETHEAEVFERMASEAARRALA